MPLCLRKSVLNCVRARWVVMEQNVIKMILQDSNGEVKIHG